jgi:hypothetical protein
VPPRSTISILTQNVYDGPETVSIVEGVRYFSYPICQIVNQAKYVNAEKADTFDFGAMSFTGNTVTGRSAVAA